MGKVYRDQGSGLDLNRPGLTALRAAVARGEVSSVLIADHMRLARDLALYQEVAGEWGRAGVVLIIAGG